MHIISIIKMNKKPLAVCVGTMGIGCANTQYPIGLFGW